MKAIRHGPSKVAAPRCSAVSERAQIPRPGARLAPIVGLVMAIVATPARRAAGADWEAIFSNNPGSGPETGLTLGSDGNFYGTTRDGGAIGRGIIGYGTVFKMTPAGELKTLVSFNYTNGRYPSGRLTEGIDGNFYGTTSGGGANGGGTVFRVTPAGKLTTLVNFNSADGYGPAAGLTLSSDGDFYATTSLGGASGHGTIFKVSPAGALTPLVSFNGTNGSSPDGGLTAASDGNFYGTTAEGGASGRGRSSR